MQIGSTVKMNGLSSYSGQTGKIFKISDSGTNFIIELDSGLVIKAPIEVIDFTI